MGSHSSFPLALILLFTCYCLSDADWSSTSSFSSSSSSSSRPVDGDSYTSFIEGSCSVTPNPDFCFWALARYAKKINGSSHRVAQYAMSLCHAEARSTADIIVHTFKKQSKREKLNETEMSAVLDCSEVMSDFHDTLGPSMHQLAIAKPSDREHFSGQIEDVKTALRTAANRTDTCANKLSQLKSGDLWAKIEDRVGRVSQLTKIAFALVKKYGEGVQKKWKVKEHKLYYYYNNLP